MKSNKQDKPEEKRGRNKYLDGLIKIAKVLIIFIFAFLIVYITLNWSALYSKFLYWYQTEALDKKYTASPGPLTVSSQLPSPYLSNPSMPTVKDNSGDNNQETNDSQKNANSEVSMANNQLLIPKLNVRVPVIWQIEADKAIKKLREGVVHIKGTSLPGQEGGNTFISGHSSYYPWDPGKYKHIFSVLPNIEKGDVFYINSHGTTYKYEVFKTVVVKPNDTWVTKPADNKTIASLMTCVPIGTSLRRFVAQADQIKPVPGEGEATETKNQDTQRKEPEEVPDDLLPRIFN